MNENTALVLSTQKDLKPAETRKDSWGNFGYNMSLCEIELLNGVTKFLKESNIEDITDIVPLISIENIPKISILEEALTYCKNGEKHCTDSRKKYTTTMDTVAKRMMIPEKTWKAYQEIISKAILQLQRLQREENEKKSRRLQELADFKAKCLKDLNEEKSQNDIFIVSKCSEILQECLSEMLRVEDIQDVIAKELLSNRSFEIPKSEFRDVEKQEIWNHIFSQYNPKDYITKFRETLFETFVGYEDKLAELSLTPQTEEEVKEELQQKIESIKEEKELDNAMAETEAVVTKPVAVIGKRNVKKFYTISNDWTWEFAFLIIREFFTQKNKAQEMYKGTSPENCKVGDMAKVLCKMKEANPDYNPAGIVFEEDEKLGR